MWSSYVESRKRQAQLTRWRNDPVAYAKERFGLTTWGKFEEIAVSVRDNRITVAKSANSIGKTECAAFIASWWLECNEQAVVLITGSSWNSVGNVLMPRIHKFVRKHNVFPKNVIHDTDIWVSDERHLVARSASEPEGIQGYHSPNLLEIVEESSGLDPRINEALRGNATGENNRILYLGNPLQPNGVFFDLCLDNKPITISALEHPNVLEGREVIPGAVTRTDIEQKAKDWCRPCSKDTPDAITLFWKDEWYIPDHRFTARVLGEFPKQSSDSLLSEALVREASKRFPIETDSASLGCDVARFGDDETVVVEVGENGFLSMETWRGKMTTETAGYITNRFQSGSIQSCAVDDTGVGGGVTDILTENHVDVEAVNFGESSSQPERFANVKAEICWTLKEELETNKDFVLPDDDEFIRQAIEVRYTFDSKGRIVIEPKAQYKKRTGRSPDRFEALAIAWYAMTRGGVYVASSARTSSPNRQEVKRYGRISDEVYN